jgi:NAD+ synthase (glutamine-hydrolysing)
MKLGVAQINLGVGNLDFYFDKLLATVNNLITQNAEIIALPQLALTGVPAEDFLKYTDYLQKQDDNLAILKTRYPEIHLLVGGVLQQDDKLYNVIFYLHNDKIQKIFPKQQLIEAEWLDEKHYFEAGKRENHFIEIDGKRISINFDCFHTDVSYQSDVLLFFTTVPAHRYKELSKNFKKKLKVIQKPAVVLNYLGSEGRYLFAGGSYALNSAQETIVDFPFLQEKQAIVDLNTMEELPAIDTSVSDIEFIHNALIFGIKDYFNRTGFKKAIIGLSGGIDSAVVAALAVEALGKDNVQGILMPSEFSSSHSVDDAIALSENLEISHETLPIKNTYDSFLETLNPLFKDLPFNVAEENLQARIRGTLLMAVANKFNAIVLNTSNKSEALVGYGTLYGDLVGSIGVIEDLYKTEVYELAHFINRNKKIIPTHILEKAPSAELHPDQKDSDSLPPYDVLDNILREFVEHRHSKSEIIAMGYDEHAVNHTIELLYANDYKKFQVPPPLVVTGKGKYFPLLLK